MFSHFESYLEIGSTQEGEIDYGWLWNNNTCCLSNTANIMPADAVATLRGRAPTVFVPQSRNIPSTASEELMIIYNVVWLSLWWFLQCIKNMHKFAQCTVILKIFQNSVIRISRNHNDEIVNLSSIQASWFILTIRCNWNIFWAHFTLWNIRFSSGLIHWCQWCSKSIPWCGPHC